MLKPIIRAVKYNILYHYAVLKSQNPISLPKCDKKSVTFIVGCGRSGTTILGELFSLHSQIYYLFEPYHLWAAIDDRTDVLNLFSKTDSLLLMNEMHYRDELQQRFSRLIDNRGTYNQSVVEKTPLNAMRIGYLNVMAPDAKFINIVRDGVDVAHSIAKLANQSSYKISGKANLNQWWGVDNAKWTALERDGTSNNYFAEEIQFLQSHESKAAYEWLVTLSEVDKWRSILGHRLMEVTYEDLVTEPQATLQALCNFLHIEPTEVWLTTGVKQIKPAHQNKNVTLELPMKIGQAFNSYQQKYGFVNRAHCTEL